MRGAVRTVLSVILFLGACISAYPQTENILIESPHRDISGNDSDDITVMGHRDLTEKADSRIMHELLGTPYVKEQLNGSEFLGGQLYARNGSAQEKKSNPPLRGTGQRIVIFNFTAAGEPEMHEPYEYIIPQTVAKNLSASGGFIVRRVQEKFSLIGITVNAAEHIRSAGSVYSADFIISGNVNISAQTLNIDVRIHNAKTGTTGTLQTSSHETGVLLKDTIDQLSEGIQRQILAQAAQREPERTGSPFLRFYQSLEGLTFGFQGGYAFIKRPWRFRFNDNFYYRTFLQYRFIPYFGISLNLDYFSTDNIGCYRFNNTLMTQWIPTIELKLFLPLSRYLRVSLSLGGGAAFTRIAYRPYNDDNPFEIADATRHSSDPHLSSSASLDFTPGPLVLSIGFSYRHTFIYGRQFQWITPFVSLGYSF